MSESTAVDEMVECIDFHMQQALFFDAVRGYQAALSGRNREDSTMQDDEHWSDGEKPEDPFAPREGFLGSETEIVVEAVHPYSEATPQRTFTKMEVAERLGVSESELKYETYDASVLKLYDMAQNDEWFTSHRSEVHDE
jgi:hypothetical protein